MHRPLRIEVPDEQHATSLSLSLQTYEVERQAVDGQFEVRVNFVERNPESRVGKVLNAIDEWLLTAELPFVRIHLDGTSYTLHRPTLEPPLTAAPH